MVHKKRKGASSPAVPPSLKGGGARILSPAQVAKTAKDITWSFPDAIPNPGVILVLGAQGEGKTSLAFWAMAEWHQRSQGRLQGAVFKPTRAMKKLLPNWIAAPQSLLEIPERSVCLIDEGQQHSNARRASSSDNLEMSNLVALARQREQTIIVVTHFSRKIDFLEAAEAKRVIWKRPNAAHVMWERSQIKPFAMRAYETFQHAVGDTRELAYVLDFETLRMGMLRVKQANFWTEAMSSAMSALAC